MKLKTRLLPLLLAISLAGCTPTTVTTTTPGTLPSTTDKTLAAVATALNTLQAAIGTVQTTVIQANTSGLLTQAQTQSILQVTQQVSAAGLQAVAITQGIASLTSANKSSLTAIFTPIIASLSTAQTEVVLGIKDTKTQQSVQIALLAIQTTLNVVQVALAQ